MTQPIEIRPVIYKCIDCGEEFEGSFAAQNLKAHMEIKHYFDPFKNLKESNER